MGAALITTHLLPVHDSRKHVDNPNPNIIDKSIRPLRDFKNLALKLIKYNMFYILFYYIIYSTIL
jgi:hypothetical protein